MPTCILLREPSLADYSYHTNVMPISTCASFNSIWFYSRIKDKLSFCFFFLKKKEKKKKNLKQFFKRLNALWLAKPFVLDLLTAAAMLSWYKEMHDSKHCISQDIWMTNRFTMLTGPLLVSRELGGKFWNNYSCSSREITKVSNYVHSL